MRTECIFARCATLVKRPGVTGRSLLRSLAGGPSRCLEVQLRPQKQVVGAEAVPMPPVLGPLEEAAGGQSESGRLAQHWVRSRRHIGFELDLTLLPVEPYRSIRGGFVRRLFAGLAAGPG